MGENLQVLVIEDNDIDLLLATKLLQLADASVEVSHCENGEAAVAHLQQGKQYHVVLLDLNMPVMSGLEFLKARTELKLLCSTPIVVLSSSVDERDMLKCKELKANHYMEKPLNLSKAKEILALCSVSTVAG